MLYGQALILFTFAGSVGPTGDVFILQSDPEAPMELGALITSQDQALSLGIPCWDAETTKYVWVFKAVNDAGGSLNKLQKPENVVLWNTVSQQNCVSSQAALQPPLSFLFPHPPPAHYVQAPKLS